MFLVRSGLVALLGATLMVGCASQGDPRDPFEPMNRAVYSFNKTVDEAALKPVATAYRETIPTPVQSGVRNFFSNLNDVTVLVNDVLQFKLEAAVTDFLRISFNSVFGLFGLVDIASEMGLTKNNEDFGQTLGRWGVGSGPYVVLPFFGPSNVRDGAGLVVDAVHTDLLNEVESVPARNVSVVTRVVSRRADLLDAVEAVEAAALDEYEFTRDFYLDRRESLVYDGRPPVSDL